jgi:hypothetical protein
MAWSSLSPRSHVRRLRDELRGVLYATNVNPISTSYGLAFTGGDPAELKPGQCQLAAPRTYRLMEVGAPIGHDEITT